MGLAHPMIEAGLWITGTRSVINGHPAEDSTRPVFDLPYAHLGLPQYETERILTEALTQRGIAVERGIAFVDLRQTEAGVTVQLQDATGAVNSVPFDTVIGCDGAHSRVRQAIGAAFEGGAYPWSFMLGDVHIDWDLPYGLTFRSVQSAEAGPPQFFIAIPLPERGRYRVTMLAPPGLAGGATDHGIQAEWPPPSLADLQAVADVRLTDPVRLTDLRWSSIFRISLRLASRYSQGRVFIAGDAAHIHPPTGGQGMNTGIQDAYNLGWKLALVLRGQSAPALLDSYGAERRPVGADVLARTRAASEGFGREQGSRVDAARADTQMTVSYRGSPIVRDEAGVDIPGPKAGDRAPDMDGLAQLGVGFPVRLFDALRGTAHVVIVRVDTGGDVEAFAGEIACRYGGAVKLIAIVDGTLTQHPGMTVLRDDQQRFGAVYGPAGAFAVRPDGYIGWRGQSWREGGLFAYLDRFHDPAASA